MTTVEKGLTGGIIALIVIAVAIGVILCAVSGRQGYKLYKNYRERTEPVHENPLYKGADREKENPLYTKPEEEEASSSAAYLEMSRQASVENSK